MVANPGTSTIVMVGCIYQVNGIGRVGASSATKPNNRLQATAGGLGGAGPVRRAFAHRA